MLFNLAPVRNTVEHTILGYFPILQSNHLQQLLISKEHIFFDCITSCNHKLQITSQIGTGLALPLDLTKVMARAMAMCLAWAIVKARPISRTIKQ